MSNLSELLPAGAGAKSAKFVASGTLASGQTVALKSDGTVSAISAQVSSDSVFESAQTLYLSSTFDSANNKVVIFYSDYGNSQYGTAIVGTVSGTAISFGTAVVFNSASHNSISSTFDNNANKNIVVYNDGGASNNGKAIVGTVSGTSISFGSEGTFNAASTTNIGSAFDSTANKVVVAFRDDGNSDYGTAVVGTVSGTSISFGSEAVFETNQTSLHSLAYDPDENKTVLNYRHDGASGHGKSRVGTVSGTSISFGSAVTFNAASTSSWISSVYDTTNNKIVVGYTDGGNSSLITGIVGTVSGTSISFGTSQIIGAGILGTTSLSFDSGNNKVSFFYYYQASPYSGNIVAATVSGTSISFATPFVVQSTQIDGAGNMTSVYDSNAGRVVAAYRHIGNSQYGTANVIDFDGNPSSNFIGITDEAIANTASGSVIVQGGVITNTGLIPLGPSLGTRTAFSSVQSQYVKSTFDSSNNKTVTVYTDNNGYGVAVVGTVSGLSISFGTPVIFNSNQTNDTCATFDTNYNKVFISYANSSTFPQGRVGTVSGTSISFGSQDAYINSQCINIAATFDSNLNKVVVAYADSGNSGYAKSQVITLDGGASPGFSYGTPVVFNSKNTEYITSTFDSSNNKVVLAYAASDNTNGVRVGTVSGSAISFGTELAFHAASQASYISSTFDTTNNKVVIFFAVGGANSGEAVVGTVSGTNITLGTQVRVGNATSINFTGVCFDSSQNKIMLAYRGVVGGTYLGRLAIGTVSGTSITVADSVTFNAVTTAWNGPIFDSNANRTAIIYQDGGSPYNGYGIVVNLTSDLVIGTDYFVQTDGTISTTSSTVPAGRALSTTSMLLEG